MAQTARGSPSGKPRSLVLAHPTMFTAFELGLFEETILGNPQATEHDASRFFERFPQFLLLGGGSELRREVVLFARDGEPIGRADFFRRPYGKRYWDIVELKTPQASLVVNAEALHPKLSSVVDAAIAQIEDYRDLIDTSPPMRQALMARGIYLYKPEMLVVAGQENREVEPEIIATLFDRVRRKGIQLRSYTDLFRFAKEHYLSNKVIIVPAGLAHLRARDEFALLSEAQLAAHSEPGILARIEQTLMAVHNRRSMKPTRSDKAAETVREAESQALLHSRALFARYIDTAISKGRMDPNVTDAVRKTLRKTRDALTYDAQARDSAQRRLEDFEEFCRAHSSANPEGGITY